MTHQLSRVIKLRQNFEALGTKLRTSHWDVSRIMDPQEAEELFPFAEQQAFTTWPLLFLVIWANSIGRSWESMIYSRHLVNTEAELQIL